MGSSMGWYRIKGLFGKFFWITRGLDKTLSQQTLQMGDKLIIILLIYILLLIILILLLKGPVHMGSIILVCLLRYIIIISLVLVWIPWVIILLPLIIIIVLFKVPVTMKVEFMTNVYQDHPLFWS